MKLRLEDVSDSSYSSSSDPFIGEFVFDLWRILKLGKEEKDKEDDKESFHAQIDDYNIIKVGKSSPGTIRFSARHVHMRIFFAYFIVG